MADEMEAVSSKLGPLGKKVGPLPLWAWGAVVVGAIVVVKLMGKMGGSSGGGTSAEFPTAQGNADNGGGSAGGPGSDTAPVSSGGGGGGSSSGGAGSAGGGSGGEGAGSIIEPAQQAALPTLPAMQTLAAPTNSPNTAGPGAKAPVAVPTQTTLTGTQPTTASIPQASAGKVILGSPSGGPKSVAYKPGSTVKKTGSPTPVSGPKSVAYKPGAKPVKPKPKPVPISSGGKKTPSATI